MARKRTLPAPITLNGPLILDLFCGAGGVARGYDMAGYTVALGVDIEDQPGYPYPFYRGDAIEVLDILLSGAQVAGLRLEDLAAITTSPPCQEFSNSRGFRKITGVIKERARLITPIYERLRAAYRLAGVAWIIENVEGAPMPDPVMLCGSMFGLPMQRHRLFSSSHVLTAPRACKHAAGSYNVLGGKVRGYGAYSTGKEYASRDGGTRRREGYPPKAIGEAAMGIDWMNLHEMSESIPPAYTRWLGAQLLDPRRLHKLELWSA